ncbi:hypothetical protein ACOMHN_002385 [Nucella lapillus]
MEWKLRALNVSSCSIGDQHEILFHISTLTSLEVLVLRNNNLTDEGIRRLTAPLRIKKTGPLGLKTLDLSENADVTVGSLKFLRVFRELTLLNLSFTAIQELQHRQSVPELREYARGRSLVVLTAVSEKLRSEVRVMTEVKTKGWASQVISSWRQEGEEACRPATHHRFKARRFWGYTDTYNWEKEGGTRTPTTGRRRGVHGHLQLGEGGGYTDTYNWEKEGGTRTPTTGRRRGVHGHLQLGEGGGYTDTYNWEKEGGTRTPTTGRRRGVHGHLQLGEGGGYTDTYNWEKEGGTRTPTTGRRRGVHGHLQLGEGGGYTDTYNWEKEGGTRTPTTGRRRGVHGHLQLGEGGGYTDTYNWEKEGGTRTPTTGRRRGVHGHLQLGEGGGYTDTYNWEKEGGTRTPTTGRRRGVHGHLQLGEGGGYTDTYNWEKEGGTRTPTTRRRRGVHGHLQLGEGGGYTDTYNWEKEGDGTDKNLKPPLALPPRKKDWAETGVGSLVLIHDSLVPSFASSTTAQHGGVSPSSSLQATAASVPSNLVTTRLPPRGGGQSSSTTPPPPPPQVTVLSASLATRTPPVQDEVFCSTPGTLQQSPGSASLCRAFQEGSQSPLTTERPATSAASCRFEGKGSNRQSAGAGATPSPKKIREEARSSSAKSCSHSLKDNQQLRIKKQDSADVATQGSNESKSVRKNKLKTSAGLNQASSMSGCLKLQSANDDRLEERSLHRASRGERVQQGCYARGSGQQKRRREEEDLGQDDLVLLCQYGYSGK